MNQRDFLKNIKLVPIRKSLEEIRTRFQILKSILIRKSGSGLPKTGFALQHLDFHRVLFSCESPKFWTLILTHFVLVSCIDYIVFFFTHHILTRFFFKLNLNSCVLCTKVMVKIQTGDFSTMCGNWKHHCRFGPSWSPIR